tara:strand:- start:11583 stop:17192 length:5610 start_codon:yes stop_codon:yes gene_type:complete
MTTSDEFYKIHLQCTVGVHEDSGGTIYIGVFTNDYGTVNELENNGVKDDMIQFLFTESNITTINFNESDLVVQVDEDINYVFDTIYSIEYTPIELVTYYSVYVIARDSYGNQSDLFYGGRGQIHPQEPPTVSFQSLYQLDAENDAALLYYTLESTVKCKARFILSSSNIDANSLNENDFLNPIPSIVDGYYYDTGNILTTLESNVHTFTKYINDFTNQNDYDPFVDYTKNLFVYAYTNNYNPHNQHEISGPYEIQRFYDPEVSFVASIVDYKKRDYSTELTIQSSHPNVEYFVALFNSPIYDPDNNGLLKTHTFQGGLHDKIQSTSQFVVSISEYYTELGNINSNTSLQHANNYYVYLFIKHISTNQYSEFANITIVTGAEPILLTNTAEYVLENNTIIVSASIEEESGGVVHGVLFEEPLSVDEMNSLSIISMEEITTSLPNHVSNISYTFNNYYSTINNLSSLPIDIEHVYYVYFHLSDTLNNSSVYLFNKPVFQTSLNTELVLNEHIHYDFGSFQLNNNNNYISNNTIGNIDVQFYEAHKTWLGSVEIDLTHSECTDIVELSIYASNVPNIFETQLPVVGNTNIKSGQVHHIPITTPYSRVNSYDYLQQYYRIVIKSSESVNIFTSIRFNIEVYDDRKPTISNLGLTDDSNTRALISFDISEYNDVIATGFLSLYEYGNQQEIDDIHDTLTSTYSTDFIYTANKSITTNTVIVDPYSSTSVYDQQRLSDYYVYLRFIDQSPLNNTNTVKINPDGRSDIISPPVITDHNVITLYSDSSAIRITSNISQPSVEYTPFKYINIVLLQGTALPSPIPYPNEYHFEDVVVNELVHSTYYNEPIREGESYDVYTYAMSGSGYESYHTTNDLELVSEPPLVHIDNITKMDSSTIRVRFQMIDNLSEANVYVGLFLNEPTSGVNLFLSTYTTPVIESKNIGNVTIDFYQAYASEYNVDETVILDADGTSYYIIAYAQETYAINPNSFQANASYYGMTLGEPSNDDIIGTNPDLTTDTYDDVLAIVSEGDTIDMPFSGERSFITDFGGDRGILTGAENDPQTITITASFFPTNLDNEITLFTIGAYSLHVHNQMVYVNEFGITLFQATNNIRLRLKKWNNVVFIVDEVGSQISIYINHKEYTHTNITLGSSGSITIGPFYGGVTNISATEIYVPPSAIISQTDVFPPQVIVDSSNITVQDASRIVCNEGTFTIEDSMSCSVYFGIFDSYYGSSQPFTNQYDLIVNHLTNPAKLKQDGSRSVFKRILADDIRSLVLETITFTEYSDLTNTYSLNATDNVYHLYAFTEDTKTPVSNSKLLYCGPIYGQTIVDSETPLVPPVISSFTFNSNSDERVANIQLSSIDDISPTFIVSAYPASIQLGYSGREIIQSQMLAYGTHFSSLTNRILSSYFTDLSTSEQTTMSYNENYVMYVLAIHPVTNLMTLSEDGILANTALEPSITNISLNQSNISSLETEITLVFDVYEESSSIIYTALFVTSQTMNDVVRFFEESEFDTLQNTRYKIHRDPTDDVSTHSHTFTHIHTNILFHDEITRIHGDHTIYAYVYVKDTQHATRNIIFESISPYQVSLNDYNTNPTISITSLNTNDKSFVVSANVIHGTYEISNTTLDTTIKIAAFTQSHDNSDLIDFFNTDFVSPSVTIQTIDHTTSLSNTSDNVKDYTNIILTNAISMHYLNKHIVVKTSGSNYLFYNDSLTNNPEIFLLKGCTYIINQDDSSNNFHPIYFEHSDGSEFTDGIYYIADGIKYETKSEYKNVFSGATSRYIRFTVPQTSDITHIYYRCMNHYNMTNTVYLLNEPSHEDMYVSTKTTFPFTDYYIYAYVDNDTPRLLTDITSSGPYQTGIHPTISTISSSFSIKIN